MLSESDFKDVIVLQAFQALVNARKAASLELQVNQTREAMEGLVERLRTVEAELIEARKPATPPADSEGGTPE